MNEIEKRKEYGARRAVWLRNYQRARARALTRLAQQYPDQYKDFLEEEREKDEKENKAWLDLSGRTNASVGAPTDSDNGEATEGLGSYQQEGKLGGEK